MSDTEKTEEFSAKKVGTFLQESFSKGEMKLKHAVGLGQTPNAVPEGEPKVNEAARQVEIGWHPVGGLAGKWFADRTGLGKMITEKVNKYPDPTQHWAVLVGDYVHQLWMDESFHVIYINGKIDRDEWKTFEVGQTRLNDDAIRRAGVATIEEIREKQPVYNLISNNCQTYALQLLDAIKASGQKEFGTTLAVYDRMFGPGNVMELFDKPEDVPTTAKPAQPEGEVQPEPEAGAEGEEKPEKEHTNISLVSYAQKLMNQHTTQVDAHEKANASDDHVEDSEQSTRDADEGSRDGSTSGKIEKLKEKKDKLMSFFKRK